jgi:hypothetical protein
VAAGGGRLLRRISAAAVFTGAAVATGALTNLGWGLLGEIGRLDALWFALAFVLLVASVAWYAKRGITFPFARQGAQANREWARWPAFGLFYFGGLMGIGILTAMSTPLVYAGVAMSLALGPLWGVLYGAAFGIGRSIPAFVGAALGPSIVPESVASGISIRFQSEARVIGLLATVMTFATLIALTSG